MYKEVPAGLEVSGRSERKRVMVFDINYNNFSRHGSVEFRKPRSPDYCHFL